MSTPEKGYNINQTFIIEGTDNDGIFSACTALFTANIYACTGNTQILLGSNSINMVGDIFVSGDLSATTVSATTYYGDGSNLTGISTQDTFVTGGTYSDGIAIFTNNTGGTFSVSGFYTGTTDVFVTGGTYATSASTLTFTNNTGGTFNVTGITTSSAFTGGTVTGSTLFNGGLFATTISATTYENLPLDITVTGGTYSDGSATFTNNTGGTFSVNGFYTGATDVFVTGGTYSDGSATFTNNTGGTFSVSGFYTGATDVFVTGVTYDNANTFTYTNNTGGTFNVLFNTVTGLTINGDLSVNSVSATTLYGDGSNITGINLSQLATTAHTHPISEVINLQNELDSKIDIPPVSYFGDYLYYNGITWVSNQINIPVAAGDGVTLFLSVTGSSLPTYEYLSRFPIELTETQDSVVVNNNQALIGKYATDQLNRTIIDSGIWEFNTFASVDVPSTGLTQIIITAYLLSTGGSETFLFSASTENITTTAATVYTFSLAEPQYSCSTTDYLVVNYSASTTNNFNTTVSLYHGGSVNYSHIHTPFVTLHNDLAGIQGGFSNEHYHLSKNEAELLTTSVDASSIHNHDSLYLSLNGGTISGNTTVNGSLSATTYLGLPTDIRVTGGTYNQSNGTTTFTNNTGGTFNVSGFTTPFTGGTVTGNTIFTNGLTATTISATTYLGLPLDIRVTGGTYSTSASTLTFTNNTGGTFNITGVTTPPSSPSSSIQFNNNGVFSGSSNFVYSPTDNIIRLSSNSATTSGFSAQLSIVDNSNSSLGSSLFSTIAGSGNNRVQGYFLSTPKNYSYNTNFANSMFIGLDSTNYVGNNNPLYFVNFLSSPSTSSAFRWAFNTAFNYDTSNDVMILTGGTAGNLWVKGNNSSNSLTVRTTPTLNSTPSQILSRNSTTGAVEYTTPFALTGNYLPLSGGTINGNITVTGNSQLNGSISSLSFTGATNRIVQVSSGGTLSATTDIISAYISSGSTAATLLSNTSNWDINGNYIGIAISGTFQGQKWYDNNYFYEAVQDNLFIRLIRG